MNDIVNLVLQAEDLMWFRRFCIVSCRKDEMTVPVYVCLPCSKLLRAGEGCPDKQPPTFWLVVKPFILLLHKFTSSNSSSIPSLLIRQKICVRSLELQNTCSYTRDSIILVKRIEDQQGSITTTEG